MKNLFEPPYYIQKRNVFIYGIKRYQKNESKIKNYGSRYVRQNVLIQFFFPLYKIRILGIKRMFIKKNHPSLSLGRKGRNRM